MSNAGLGPLAPAGPGQSPGLSFRLYQQERPGRHAQRALHDALDPLGAARPDPLYLCVILNAGWYYAVISRVQGGALAFFRDPGLLRAAHS